MSNTYQYRGLVSKGHPSLKGHFPGNPVVPGVVILEFVIQALKTWQVDLGIVEFPIVKFHKILRPDQPFEIQLQQKGACKYGFECSYSGQVIVSGTLISRAS